MPARHTAVTLERAKSRKRAGPRVALLADRLLARLAELVLGHIGAECRTVATRSEWQALARDWAPHVLLADLDLHERAPAWTRFDGIQIPCVGLTRRREARAKLDAYDRGVYDVIEVPFTPDEIVVRTLATIARVHGHRPRLIPQLQMGAFEMDLLGSSVRLESIELRLTPLEQTLLYLFIAHPGEVLSREGILDNVWGVASAITSNVIDRHIRDLRVKLGERWKAPRFIETVPGQGYRFIEDRRS